MAGSTKVAVLATLMFAMLLSGSIVDAARPIVSEGSAVAADGSLMSSSRQLKTLWPWWKFRCGLFWWYGCGPRIVPIYVDNPVTVVPGGPTVVGGGDVRIRADDGGQVTFQGRRLHFFKLFRIFKSYDKKDYYKGRHLSWFWGHHWGYKLHFFKFHKGHGYKDRR